MQHNTVVDGNYIIILGGRLFVEPTRGYDGSTSIRAQ
jgi:hypothetical protein